MAGTAISSPPHLPETSPLIRASGYEELNIPEEPNLYRGIYIHPGRGSDPVVVKQYLGATPETGCYDVVSCDDPQDGPRGRIRTSEGRDVELHLNLCQMLKQLRLPTRPRAIWTPSLCVNYGSIPERNQLHTKMELLYRNATSNLIWLGPDNAARQAQPAVSAVDSISTWICSRLSVPLSEMLPNQNVVFSRARDLPPPSASPIGTDAAAWSALAWLFSNRYFARAQSAYELQPVRGSGRLVLCGDAVTEWARLRLVAEYFVMSTAFSRLHGFAGTCAWWASSADELLDRRANWLQMLYLASNYSFADPRDYVYDLAGFMEISRAGREILAPDYSKTVVEVFRDSVEASLVHFGKPDALLYASGAPVPSWVPRWNEPKLFRNPFRFGKKLPWRPSGPDAALAYAVHGDIDAITLTGFGADTVKAAAPFNESVFDNAAAEGRGRLPPVARTWDWVLAVLATAQPATLPLAASTLRAAATALSYGVDGRGEPADEGTLTANFVAYLRGALGGNVFRTHVSDAAAGAATAAGGDGLAFGKPVWDFQYPTSSLFVTNGGLVGCCVAEVRAGDVVAVPARSTYPLVLRPVSDEDGRYELRGYAFVYGVMNGELAGTRPDARFTIQ